MVGYGFTGCQDTVTSSFAHAPGACWAIVCILCLGFLPGPAHAAQIEWLDAEAMHERTAPSTRPAEDADAHLACELAPGVAHHWIRRQNPPRLINLFRIELASSATAVSLVKAGSSLVSRQRIGQIAQHLRDQGMTPLAGVNGGFWDEASRPVGITAGNGFLYTAASHRWTFLLGESGCHLGAVTLRRHVLLGETRVAIDGYNALSPTGGLYLYTPEFGSQTPAVPPDTVGIRLALSSGARRINAPIEARVEKITSGAGPHHLDADHAWLLRLPPVPPVFQAAREGMAVRIEFRTDAIEGPADVALSAGPMLLRAGRVVLDSSERETRNVSGGGPRPRTALGVTRDGATLLLMTIEGPRTNLSGGATLEDLADEMRMQGAWHALNLDGGSSTSAWAAGERISRPTPLVGVRSISNALFVLASGQDAPDAQPEP